MDQCANVSICQPVCAHGATDWHISRMGLFIVPFPIFSPPAAFLRKARGVSPKESLQKCAKCDRESNPYLLQISVIRILVCCRSSGFLPFLFQYPFVYGHTIEVFEKAAESSGRISSQMRKFFHVLHVAVILHDEIVETFRISADRIEE